MKTFNVSLQLIAKIEASILNIEANTEEEALEFAKKEILENLKIKSDGDKYDVFVDEISVYSSEVEESLQKYEIWANYKDGTKDMTEIMQFRNQDEADKYCSDLDFEYTTYEAIAKQIK